VQYFLGILLIALAIFILRPYWTTIPSSKVAQETTAVKHINVTSMAELDQALSHARQQHKPVMVDFYADWCTSCLVLEKTVFKKPEITDLLKQFVVIRVDITQNTPANEEIQSHYGVYAPPIFVFFNKAGKIQPQLQIMGEESEGKFLETFKELTKK
jgi:thiol:disulfide interchange protein DsbD